VDIIKGLMAGAHVTMMASELISSGIPRVQILLKELQDWMGTHDYQSVHEMIGILSQQKAPEPAAFERANYMKALTLFDNRAH
jgi:dihydroorotate dehydrogenase (fumarate)